MDLGRTHRRIGNERQRYHRAVTGIEGTQQGAGSDFFPGKSPGQASLAGRGKGYVLKAIRSVELIQAIEKISAGGTN